MLKKFPADKINVLENALFFLLRAPTHGTFKSRFLYELKVCLSKRMCGIYHFRFHPVFIDVYICSTKSVWSVSLYNFIISFKIKIIKVTRSFAPRPLISKLQQEV